MHGTIEVARDDAQTAARERAYSIPLEQFDPGDPELFRTDTFWPYFERLRKEEPVHYCKDSVFGPYWSVTKYNDIMNVETNHQVYSSAAVFGGITIRDAGVDYRRPSFIAMDQPTHSAQRKTVAPMFTPTHLDQLPPPFANAPDRCWTPCRATRRSTGSTASPSSSPPRCWRRCSTSPGRSGAS